MKEIPRSEKRRPVRKAAAYFENDQLVRGLFAQVRDDLFRALCEVALKTGMRG